MADEAEDASQGRHQEPWLRLRPRSRTAPLILYFDTSALVKLLIVEEDSDTAEMLWNTAVTAVSSILAYPEGRAALARAHRLSRLDPGAYERSLSEFDEIYAELIGLALDEQLTRAAGEAATAFNLRAYDAVHLATALDMEEEVVLVTWDKDLARAAEDAGLAVAGT